MPVSCIQQLDHLNSSRETTLPSNSPHHLASASAAICTVSSETNESDESKIPSNYKRYPWKSSPPETIVSCNVAEVSSNVLCAGDDNFETMHSDGCGDEMDLAWKRNSSITLFQPPPHFKEARDAVFSDFKGKKLYLFLDYDGTLTPIVKNPWDAELPSSTRDLLYQLAGSSNNLVTVGIVTGRALTSVKNFVQIKATEQLNFIYAASHGFHIEAAGKMLHHKVGSIYIPVLKSAAKHVANTLCHIPGLTLEDNEFSFSVHYRNAAAESEAEIEKILDDLLTAYPTLKKTRGKKVFELRINVVWDKGKAVSWLLKSMRVDPYESGTRIIYVGDDLTDEDAFRAVRQFDNSLTILVSDEPCSRPTAANYFVEDPKKVNELLKDLLQLIQNSDN